jgi:ComF family protein
MHCKAQVSESSDYLEIENNFTHHFWGRVKIVTGASLYYYNKGGKVQTAIQKLKYKNKREVGRSFGTNMGIKLRRSPLYQDIDLIIPVPLHFKKEKKRGYNQSDLFAEGISTGMKIPWSRKHLKRKKNTDTQTNKNRNERIENVLSAFTVDNHRNLIGKHILLVDDVLTTGATLEACAQELIKIEGLRVSCATIAMGSII